MGSSSLSAFILVVMSLLTALLGFVVIIRNWRKQTNQFFLGFSFAVAVWVMTNAIFLIVGDDTAFIFALLSYGAAAMIGVFLLQFCLAFANKKVHWGFVLIGVLLALTTMIPGVLAVGVENHAIETTPFLPAYALFLLIHFVGAVIVLIQYRLHSKGLARARTEFIIWGLSLSLFGGSFFNLILPLLGLYDFVALGPSMSLVLVGTVAAAIIRQRLFDIKGIVLRSLSYIFFLVLLGVLYATIVLNFGSTILGVVGLQDYLQAFYILATLLIAVSFHPIKRFFDRLTKQIFFRDTYDSKEVLDEVSTILVRAPGVKTVIRETLQTMYRAVKSDYTAAIINHGPDYYVAGKKASFSLENLGDLQTLDTKKTLIVLDELDNHASKLRQTLVAANISVLVKMQTSKEHIGYLALGYKVNGSAYTTQDIDLIRIVADELAIAIQNALRFEEISRFNETLQAQVDEATRKLRDSNRQLKQLDSAKDEFISIASHQLRTPLTSVKGYLSMALEGDAGPMNDSQKRLIEEAYASAQRMVYLIGDFLNVSRLKTGKFIIEPTPVALNDLIKEEIEQLRATALARGLTIEANVPRDFPPLLVDENKIRQVIMNFIDNAIFYSTAGGKIEIDLMKTADSVIFTVQDHGIGVPAKERHQLFDKFFRATNAREMRPDGTGIGLFMAKKVVIAHGGSIIFKSEEGKGSTFGFSFPIGITDLSKNKSKRLG